MKHLIVAAAALLASSAVHAEPLPLFRYVVTGVVTTDLGTLGGPQSSAADINNNGIVVGWSDDTAGVGQSFYYTGGAMFLLSPSFGPVSNAAVGINNSNVVAGSVVVLGAARAYRMPLGSSFTLLADGSIFGDRVQSTATAISDSGLVVGQRHFIDLGGRTEATLWRDPAGFRSLEGSTFPAPTFVNDVNTAGDSVGRVRDPEIMALWDQTTSGIFSRRIPVPPGSDSCTYFSGNAYGINNVGTIVGFVYCLGATDTTRRAMHWNGRNTNSSDLGVLPTGTYSVADDINDADFVVGYANRITTGPPFTLSRDTGFLFHRDFGMYALPRAAFTLWNGHCRAKALSERRASTGVIQVAGNCDTGSGTRAVRWDVSVALRSTIPTGTFP